MILLMCLSFFLGEPDSINYGLLTRLNNLKKDGLESLSVYQDLVDTEDYCEYEQLWRNRMNGIIRAVENDNLESYIRSEINRGSYKWRLRYKTLPCDCCIGMCLKCVVYREYRQPFNNYYVDGVDNVSFYSWEIEQRFEYRVVQNYVSLRDELSNSIDWSMSHGLMLWYLRSTPCGDREFRDAVAGRFNRLQCIICRPKSEGSKKNKP